MAFICSRISRSDQFEPYKSSIGITDNVQGIQVLTLENQNVPHPVEKHAREEGYNYKDPCQGIESGASDQIDLQGHGRPYLDVLNPEFWLHPSPFLPFLHGKFLCSML